MRAVAAGYVAIAGLALGGCVMQRAEDGGSAPSGPVDRSAIEADWSQLGGDGILYLQVATSERRYDLFEVDLATGAGDLLSEVVTGPLGISAFSVSRAGIVVAEASTMTDRLAAIAPDGTMTPIRPFGGQAPLINEDGDIAAYLPVRGGTRDVITLTRSQGGAPVRLTAPTRQWTSVTWLSDTGLALLSTRRARTLWRRLGVDGRLGREHLVAVGRYVPTGDYATHYGTPLVLEDEQGGPAILWQPGHRPTRLPARWRTGCTSPDGTAVLLLAPDAVGVLDLEGSPDIRTVQVSGVAGCGWLEGRPGA